jgi:hypothetical protein
MRPVAWLSRLRDAVLERLDKTLCRLSNELSGDDE